MDTKWTESSTFLENKNSPRWFPVVLGRCSGQIFPFTLSVWKGYEKRFMLFCDLHCKNFGILLRLHIFLLSTRSPKPWTSWCTNHLRDSKEKYIGSCLWPLRLLGFCGYPCLIFLFGRETSVSWSFPRPIIPFVENLLLTRWGSFVVSSFDPGVWWECFFPGLLLGSEGGNGPTSLLRFGWVISQQSLPNHPHSINSSDESSLLG